MGGTSATAVTPEKREAFISHLSDCGNVTEAARQAGIARWTAYKMRRNDPDFETAWEDAVEQAADKLEQEARRRAMGWDDTYVDKEGNERTSYRYSDTLMIFLLKGIRPDKYRERYDSKTTIDFSRHTTQQLLESLPEAIAALPEEQKRQLEAALKGSDHG